MSTFDSTKFPLPQILADITVGKIQLPDFQRGWVWDDEHVKSLLVSIARSFPVGAVMMLDAGGDIRFQVRLIENVDFPGNPPKPERLIAFQESRLDTMRSRVSAAYKGLNVLVLREGAQDFFWKETIHALNHEDMALDIHHIFPRDWCRKNGIKRSAYDSVVNRTPISLKANRMIGGKAPSEYLAALQSHRQVVLTEEEMNYILSTHRIPSLPLRSDDFRTFYARRKNALIELIEKATGKDVQRDQSHRAETPETADVSGFLQREYQ